MDVIEHTIPVRFAGAISCPLMLERKPKLMTTHTQRDLPHLFPLPSIFLSAAAGRAFCSLLLAATHYSVWRRFFFTSPVAII